jgi:hypothetical protein
VAWSLLSTCSVLVCNTRLVANVWFCVVSWLCLALMSCLWVDMNLQVGLWPNLFKNLSSKILSSRSFSFYLSNKTYFDVSSQSKNPYSNALR